MHVSIGKLKLIDACGSIVVAMGIVELSMCLVRDVKNAESEASEEHPLAHGSNLADPAIRRKGQRERRHKSGRHESRMSGSLRYLKQM